MDDIKSKPYIKSKASELFKNEDYSKYKKDDDGNVKEYFNADILLKILKKVNSHPEHYNAQQMLNIEVKYTKQQEIETLAHVASTSFESIQKVQ